jgi:hypothetical protein
MLLQEGVIVTVYFPKGKKKDALTKFKYHNMQVDECRSFFAASAHKAVDQPFTGLEDIGCELHASGSCARYHYTHMHKFWVQVISRQASTGMLIGKSLCPAND